MFKLKNNILLNALRRADEAHSPLHRAIFNMEEKRSNLFVDKRRIPGRKAKVYIAIGILLQIWGVKKVIDIKKFFRRRDLELRKLQRKTAPFFQAMNDIRYSALKTRNDMLVEELFEHRGKDYIQNITKRFHQNDLWSPFRYRYTYMYNKTNRTVKPSYTAFYGRYLHNYEIYNI